MEYNSRRICCVPLCKSKKSSEVTLHLFPREEKMKQTWANILKVTEDIRPFMNVCSLHFNDEDYFPGSTKRRKLKRCAIPSRNVPVHPQKRIRGKNKGALTVGLQLNLIEENTKEIDKEPDDKCTPTVAPVVLLDEDQKFQTTVGTQTYNNISFSKAVQTLELSKAKYSVGIQTKHIPRLTHISRKEAYCQASEMVFNKDRYSISDFITNDEQIISFTGCDYSLIAKLANILETHFEKSTFNKTILSSKEKIMLMLMKLKLDLSYVSLACLFKICTNTARTCFKDTYSNLVTIIQNTTKEKNMDDSIPIAYDVVTFINLLYIFRGEDTDQNLIEDTGQTLMEDTVQNLTEDTGQNLIEETTQNIIEDTTLNVIEDIGQNVIENTTLTLMEDTGQNIIGNTTLSLIEDTGQNIIGNTTLTIIGDTGQSLLGDTTLTIIGGIGQNLIDDSTLTIVEDTDQNTIDDTTLAILQDTSENIMEDTTQNIIEDLAQNILDDTAQIIIEVTGHNIPEGMSMTNSANLIQNSTADLIQNSTEDLIQNSTEDLIQNNSANLIQNTTEDLIQNNSENLIQNSTGDLIQNDSEEITQVYTDDITHNSLEDSQDFTKYTTQDFTEYISQNYTKYITEDYSEYTTENYTEYITQSYSEYIAQNNLEDSTDNLNLGETIQNFTNDTTQSFSEEIANNYAIHIAQNYTEDTIDSSIRDTPLM